MIFIDIIHCQSLIRNSIEVCKVAVNIIRMIQKSIMFLACNVWCSLFITICTRLKRGTIVPDQRSAVEMQHAHKFNVLKYPTKMFTRKSTCKEQFDFPSHNHCYRIVKLALKTSILDFECELLLQDVDYLNILQSPPPPPPVKFISTGH